MNTLLISFGISAISTSPNPVIYRIVDTHRGELLLEKKDTDLLGDARWAQVPFQEVLTIFATSARWSARWKVCSSPLLYGGAILDTRQVEKLPKNYRGVIHQYAMPNNHAPDNEYQDVYIEQRMRDLTFTSSVWVLVPAAKDKAEQVLLGAIYVLAQGEVTVRAMGVEYHSNIPLDCLR